MAYTFEAMADQHRKAVIDIFNHYVTHSYAAYPDEPVNYAFYDVFLDMVRGYPAVVVTDENQAVQGFAFLHPYRAGRTFQRVAEITTFIHPEHTGKGVGTAILEQFRAAAKEQGIETFLANISSRNEGSLRFHARHGFQECGRFRRIGKKFGEDLTSCGCRPICEPRRPLACIS